MDSLLPNHIVGNHLATDTRQFVKADGNYGYTHYGDDFWDRPENPIVHVNHYGNWADRNHLFASRIRKQLRHGKPIWFAETGLSVWCEDRIRLCILEDKVSFHHNLWAMGLSGAIPGSHFWGERIYAYGLFRQYRAVNRFFEGEDLHQRGYKPVVQHRHPYKYYYGVVPEDASFAATNDDAIDFFGLRSTDQQKILGYIQNRTVTWYNFPAPASDLKYPRTGDYEHFDYDPPVPPPGTGPPYRVVRNPELTFSRLLPRARYRFVLWSTTGEGGPLDSAFVETDRHGTLTLRLPDLEGRLEEGAAFLPGAWAFKLELDGGAEPDLVQWLDVWPNPAFGEVSVAALLYAPVAGDLTAYDALGRQVWRSEWEAGEQRHSWDLDVSGWGAGVYWLRLQAGEEGLVKRLVVGR